MVQACRRRDIDDPCRINFPRGRAGCHKPARRHASGFLQHVVFFVYKGILWMKTDLSCDGRLLVEELPLAGLHKMDTVHTRSYRGYCCLDAGRHVCSKDRHLTGERAEAPCSYTAGKAIQMLREAGSQA